MSIEERKMPYSLHEYTFYALCLQTKIPIFLMRQDTKQDIRGYTVKNFDFICHSQEAKQIFLIDLKGSSGDVEDTKVSENDIKSLERLQKIYGPNVTGLFIFFWLKETTLKGDLFGQTYKIKALSLDEYKEKMRSQGKWGSLEYFRCGKKVVRDIWDYIPELKIRA
jgi:hypothetical protein